MDNIHNLLKIGEENKQNGKFQSIDDLLSFFQDQSSAQKPLSFVQYTFHQPLYFLKSMTHSSFAHEYKYLGIESNERLEFLGDSVLSTIVSTHLINEFPEFDEGVLSKFRSSLVNGQTFAELGLLVDLGPCLLLGKGEYKSQGHQKEALLSNAFEAFIGAIYRDGGFDQAIQCFYTILEQYKQEHGEEFINANRLESFDSKSRLQEKTMSLYKSLPEYKAVQSEDFEFQVELMVEGEVLATMKHSSKKKAERLLATEVLKNKKYINLKKSNK